MQIKNGPQSLEVSKIRGKNKKNFEKCWSSIINNCFPNRLVETSGDCEWTDNIEYTIQYNTIQYNIFIPIRVPQGAITNIHS